MSGKLTLIFDDGEGEQYRVIMPLDKHTARQFTDIKPPMRHGLPFSERTVQLDSFEAVVETLRVRQFRKDVFISEAKRLGGLLAERMEDAEGWHDVSRIEPARRALRKRSLGS